MNCQSYPFFSTDMLSCLFTDILFRGGIFHNNYIYMFCLGEYFPQFQNYSFHKGVLSFLWTHPLQGYVFEGEPLPKDLFAFEEDYFIKISVYVFEGEYRPYLREAALIFAAQRC